MQCVRQDEGDGGKSWATSLLPVRRRIAGSEDAAPPVHEVLQVSYQYRTIS